MVNAIMERAKNPGAYTLAGNNCATFVSHVLQSGGAQVPDTIFPGALMDSLPVDIFFSGKTP